MRVHHQRCEYLEDPEGIDEPQPRLGWLIDSDIRGTYQMANRIRVASSKSNIENNIPDLWDSGWIQGRNCNHVVYSGNPLQSGQKVFWSVEVLDNHGNQEMSPVAMWSMGLLEETDWKAQWIGVNKEVIERDPQATASGLTQCATPVYLRKAFRCGKAVARATLYASARGLFQFHLNGNPISQDCFAPEWTDYNVRIHYRTYNVTCLLQVGDNAIGAILGDGWYSGYVGWQESRGRYGLDNSLMAQLVVEYEDGSSEIFITDTSWKCNTGPILHSDFMMGESYDARREQFGWNLAGFQDTDWLPVNSSKPPQAKLVSQRSEPVRITQELQPELIQMVKPGTFIVDIGQNITGWIRIHLREREGTFITIRHGERLNDDGSLHTTNLRRAVSTDTYICKGEGDETWQPLFTFHGFQYCEISGLSSSPEPGTITACVVHSAINQTGNFSCSHPGVNRLWLNSLWSQRDNFLSVPTDCPQRDERLGWTGDAQVFSRTAMYNMEVAAFFTKWMTDVEDAQTENGIFPDTAPRLPEDQGNFIGLDGLGGAAAWADAGIIIPWNMWKVYGDDRILERHWGAMVSWMDYLQRTNPDWLRLNELGNNYGDWLCIPSDTSFRTHSPMKNLLATVFWADGAAKMAEIATQLNKPEEAANYHKVFENIRNAFQNEFLNPDGSLTVETQTAYLLALAMDLIPEHLRTAAVEKLVDNIRQLDWHLSTGFCGIRFLNPILTDFGHADVAYRLLFQEDYPSWLYPVKHGATTIWERWNGWTREDGFYDPHMNSFNHYSLGSVGEWLFSHVAGIRTGTGKGGFSSFLLKPYPSKGLDFAKASYRSIEGIIESEWRWDKDHLLFSFTIPANTTARVFISADDDSRIFEGENLLDENAMVEFVHREGSFSIYDFPSGSYRIRSKFIPRETTDRPNLPDNRPGSL